MTLFKTFARFAGLVLCVVAIAGPAAAGNGGGNENGKSDEAPGQAKKAETPAATAPAPAAAAQPAAKAQAKKAEKADKKPAQAAAKPAKPTKPAKPAQAAKPDKPAKSENASAKSQGESKGRSAEAHHHVIICHRTGSDSNPYVVINIPWTAWSEAHSPDTGAHPDLNGRHDIMLKDPASRPGSKDGFTKASCGAPAVSAVAQEKVCPNGQQHKQDDKGNCAPKQEQRADVCPNIEGHQSTVPAGLVTDSQGNCVQQQTDVCPNIEGMQTSVPAGMVKDSQGNCAAPTVVAAAAAQAPAPPAVGVAGAVSPALPKSAKAKAPAPAKEKPAGGVLGAVATAPEAIAETATGELPFTGIPLWIAALLGGGLLAAGLVLRRASATH